MCSGPSVQKSSGTSTPARRTQAPRVVDPDGEQSRNTHVERSDEAKERQKSLVGMPGFEGTGTVVDVTTDPAGTGTPVKGPGLFSGLTTIGRFALNHTRPTGITALKPGFPKIGR